MPNDITENWLKSHKAARIGCHVLRPVEHPGMAGTVLSFQKGQAEAYVLQDQTQCMWVLKKFHNGCNLDRSYLEQIATILPPHEGFKAGTDRVILSKDDLIADSQFYHCMSLAQWLDGCVLMSKIKGLDWATLADDIRDGELELETSQRIALCQSLCELIDLLESHQLAHRDLSSGNIFLDTSNWNVSLIDFDSLYGPSLSMPSATTCGTTGYTAPYTWQNGNLDASATWCPHADRYALAILIAEILILSKGAPLTAEGGMFSQQELRQQQGGGIHQAFDQLFHQFPQASALFSQAIQSQGFEDCPTPGDWLSFCQSLPSSRIKPPALGELEIVTADYFSKILAKQRPAAPLWPAPSLSDLPDEDIQIIPVEPAVPIHPVLIPPDPWEVSHG